jgi:hypothetical protein
MTINENEAMRLTLSGLRECYSNFMNDFNQRLDIAENDIAIRAKFLHELTNQSADPVGNNQNTDIFMDMDENVDHV